MEEFEELPADARWKILGMVIVEIHHGLSSLLMLGLRVAPTDLIRVADDWGVGINNL